MRHPVRACSPERPQISSATGSPKASPKMYQGAGLAKAPECQDGTEPGLAFMGLGAASWFDC